MTNDRKKQAADLLKLLSHDSAKFADEVRIAAALLAKELYEDESGYDKGYVDGWRHAAQEAASKADKLADMAAEEILGD